MLYVFSGGTRTCIQTPGVEYTPKDLQPETVDQILGDTSLIYFDGRLTDSAVLLAKAARQRGVPVLVEAERVREGLHELLQQADYLCTSAHFPKVQLRAATGNLVVNWVVLALSHTSVASMFCSKLAQLYFVQVDPLPCFARIICSCITMVYAFTKQKGQCMQQLQLRALSLLSNLSDLPCSFGQAETPKGMPCCQSYSSCRE